MKTMSLACLGAFFLVVAGCGSNVDRSTPEALYVSFEHAAYCTDTSIDDVVGTFMMPGYASQQYVTMLRAHVASDSSGVQKECETWNEMERDLETHSRMVGNNRWVIEGQTVSGGFRVMPGIYVTQDKDGDLRLAVGNPQG